MLAIPGLLESVVEHVPAMIFLKEAAELRFLLFNRAAEELLGFARGDLYGKNDYDIFPKEQADFFTRKDREVLASGRLLCLEEPVATARGERWLLTRKIPIVGEGGVPHYLLGVSVDITERRNYEEALEANVQLREVLGTLLSLEGVAAAGAMASRTGGQIEAALSAGPGGEREARSLAASLARLGSPATAAAAESIDLDGALAAWACAPGVQALARVRVEPSPPPGLRALVSPAALERALTALVALVARLARASGTPVLAHADWSPGGPEVCLVVPSLELTARARAELPRAEPEAALAAVLLAHSNGLLLVDAAGTGTSFRCRLCPDD